ncbi:hypothetical protein HPB48_020223 [Haemaphysalis longicornis]|uniref:Uncharacterized protein n=1 Tax=Haemaphysalis longicornis TaxID=44386 RepID=A0A9J6FDJ8_HAELO|nr:hypothetical protein HPB48_020223 [Haemaphysalis longicornis]
MHFPDPTSNDKKPSILTTPFKTLQYLHEAVQNKLLSLRPTLSMKALNPTTLERQDEKLALNNLSTMATLDASSIQHAEETAKFIRIVLYWWPAVNGKIPRKGDRRRDELQSRITAATLPQLEILKRVT